MSWATGVLIGSTVEVMREAGNEATGRQWTSSLKSLGSSGYGTMLPNFSSSKTGNLRPKKPDLEATPQGDDIGAKAPSK